MNIPVLCECGRVVLAGAELAGQQRACPSCQRSVPVPRLPLRTLATYRCFGCGVEVERSRSRCSQCSTRAHGLAPLDEARHFYERAPRTLDRRLKERAALLVHHLRLRDKSIPNVQKAAADEMEASLQQRPLVAARVLMCNEDLKRPGNEAAPALIVFSLEDVRRFDLAYLGALYDRLWSAARSAGHDPRLASALEWSHDDSWDGCVHLPAPLALGPEDYLGGIIIEPAFLSERCLVEPVVPAIVNPELRYSQRCAGVHV